MQGVFRRACSLLKPKPALRYGKVFLVDVVLDGQSSIPVEFVKVERVEFIFEDFVQESRLDGRETWVDPADYGISPSRHRHHVLGVAVVVKWRWIVPNASV